jgi:hypothetical protein
MVLEHAGHIQILNPDSRLGSCQMSRDFIMLRRENPAVFSRWDESTPVLK